MAAFRLSSSFPAITITLLGLVVLLCRVPHAGRVELLSKEWAPLTVDQAKADLVGPTSRPRKSQLYRFFGLNHFPGHALATARTEMLKDGKLGYGDDDFAPGADGYVDAGSYRQSLVAKAQVEQVMEKQRLLPTKNCITLKAL
jgi:hypothetical protein